MRAFVVSVSRVLSIFIVFGRLPCHCHIILHYPSNPTTNGELAGSLAAITGSGLGLPVTSVSRPITRQGCNIWLHFFYQFVALANDSSSPLTQSLQTSCGDYYLKVPSPLTDVSSSLSPKPKMRCLEYCAPYHLDHSQNYCSSYGSHIGSGPFPVGLAAQR